MVEVEHILKAVAQRRDEHAKVALTRPSGRDAFEYGKAVGMYTAFETTLAVINELLEADDKKEREDAE